MLTRFNEGFSTVTSYPAHKVAILSKFTKAYEFTTAEQPLCLLFASCAPSSTELVNAFEFGRCYRTHSATRKALALGKVPRPQRLHSSFWGGCSVRSEPPRGVFWDMRCWGNQWSWCSEHSGELKLVIHLSSCALELSPSHTWVIQSVWCLSPKILVSFAGWEMKVTIQTYCVFCSSCRIWCSFGRTDCGSPGSSGHPSGAFTCNHRRNFDSGFLGC